MKSLLLRLLDAYQGLDLSPKVEVARYAINRVIDIFVIGPAAVALLIAVAAWGSGASPFRLVAEGIAEAGEMFRDAPAGYVHVVDAPVPASLDAVPRVPAPSSPAELAARPHRLVPLSEWVDMQADGVAHVYWTGVILGLLIIVFVRGYRFLKGPFFTGAGRAPRT